MLKVTVQRGNDLALGPFTVDYTTVDGEARAGEDYVATSGTLTFSAGEMTRSFEVPLINDGALESDESFQVVLSNATGDARLGATTTLKVTLCDATGMAPHGYAAIQRGADGVVTLTFKGGVSKRFQDYFDLYPLEVSADLVDWQPLALLLRTNKSSRELTFVDSLASGVPARFYRVPTNQFVTAYPPPTGPFAVGNLSRLLTDATRRNRYEISTNGSFPVTVWYPAQRQAGQRPDRWIPEPIARDTSASGYWVGKGARVWLDRLPYLFSHASSNTLFASDLARCPLILYSHGWTGQRTEGAPRAEELASHGYIVVAPDHFDAANTLWPDGFSHSSLDTGISDAGLRDRVRDLVFLLDELTKWNQSDPFFAGRLDLERVGVMGKSWGGGTAAAWAYSDPRCKAAVLLDPFFGTGSSVPGFSEPSLTIRSSGWDGVEVFNASKTNATMFSLTRTDHMSLSWYWMWSAYSVAENREAARTINAYALSFFSKFLRGQDDHLLDGPPNPPDFPRVTGFRKK